MRRPQRAKGHATGQARRVDKNSTKVIRAPRVFARRGDLVRRGPVGGGVGGGVCRFSQDDGRGDRVTADKFRDADNAREMRFEEQRGVEVGWSDAHGQLLSDSRENRAHPRRDERSSRDLLGGGGIRKIEEKGGGREKREGATHNTKKTQSTASENERVRETGQRECKDTPRERSANQPQGVRQRPAVADFSPSAGQVLFPVSHPPPLASPKARKQARAKAKVGQVGSTLYLYIPWAVVLRH